MAISLSSISSELEFFNVVVEESDGLEAKVLELCHLHDLGEDDFVKEFTSFALKDGLLPLSMSTITQFEKEKLINKPSKKSSEAKTTPKPCFAQEDIGDLLSAYATPNNKSLIETTPRSSVKKRQPRKICESPGLSRLSQSPSGSQYSIRKSSGEIVQRFGTCKYISREARKANVQLIHAPSDGQNMKYMFQKLVEKAQVLNDTIEGISGYLTKQYDIDSLSHVSLPTPQTVQICGRVCCDSVGRLNARSVLLEGSRETSAGRSVAVDLSSVPQYSLFPGQITMLEGVNTTGACFTATRVFPGLSPPPEADVTFPLEEGLNVLVACGPFSTSDSLAYQPFRDLILQMKSQQPDVCILLGPFVDIKHKEVELCTEKIETYFQACMEEINNVQQECGGEFVIVPSLRDAHHHFVYPCPPFSRDSIDNPHVHFVPDPCTLNIDGLIVSVTSTDAILHLSAEEISHEVGGDRISRLIGHLLSQRNMYPLYPSHEDVPLDLELHESYCQLPPDFKPHVMILPSDLKHYVKDVSDVCVLNPGRLVKGVSGGTFSKITVAPAKNAVKAIQRIGVEILRI